MCGRAAWSSHDATERRLRPGQTVALLGVEGLVVVQVGDVLMVCPRERAQDVRALTPWPWAARRDASAMDPAAHRACVMQDGSSKRPPMLLFTFLFGLRGWMSGRLSTEVLH
ncbi:MAG: hypothetical protein IPN01_04445 [Deltaproteobacteria bacterium]|nr:hypothetical protein [Deltaproteobacteria bacterium]